MNNPVEIDVWYKEEYKGHFVSFGTASRELDVFMGELQYASKIYPEYTRAGWKVKRVNHFLAQEKGEPKCT